MEADGPAPAVGEDRLGSEGGDLPGQGAYLQYPSATRRERPLMHELFALGLIVAVVAGLFALALHLVFRAPRRREQGTPADWGLPFDAVSIPTVAGKRLYGWLVPAPDAASTLIILHGWGSNAEQMLPLVPPFHGAGMNVLLVDARNHGRSDGDSFSSMPRFAEDVGCAIDWLRGEAGFGAHRVALLGHSVGAAAVLLEASRRRDVAAVISVSSFAHPEWMTRRYLARFHLPERALRLVMRYVEWVIGHRFDHIAPMSTVCRASCPVLLVHGTADLVVPVEDARRIVARCRRSDVRLLEIPGAGHASVDRIEQNGAALIRFLRASGLPLQAGEPNP